MERYLQSRPHLSESQSNPTTASSSEGVEVPDFMLWVKEEPFIFGIVSPQPCSKITVNVLRKVAEYCREKQGYYPQMSLFEWCHLSKYKLQVPTDLSWAYFRMFDIISKPVDIINNSENKNTWDVLCESIRCGTLGNSEEFVVDTLKFLVFLYIQNYLRLHKKYFTLPPSSDDPWPLQSSPSSSRSSVNVLTSPSPGSPRGSASGVLKKRSIPEQIQAEFLVANLGGIIDLLKLAVVSDAEGDDIRMPLEVVSALSFILGAASISPHDREFKSLEESILVLPEVSEIVDYDHRTKTLDKSKFILWVKTNLKLNPWGPTSTPVPQHQVECVTGIWEKTKAYELNRVYWNTQLYPKGWYLISTVDNQVIYLEPDVPLASLKIHRCNNSFIYVPGVFTSVIIEKCRNSTIFLGAAAKVVKIVDCSNISFIGVGRVFILCDLYKSTFHLLTPCQPIICGSKNRRITLAPYNTFYPKLEEHLNMVSLGVTVQKWNKPLELGPTGLPIAKGQASNHTFLQPEKFNNFCFSFEMEGETVRNPVELPSEYAQKLNKMQSRMEELREEVRSRNLTDEQKNQFNAILSARFEKWLKEKGHIKEIKGLRSMQRTIRAGSSEPILDISRKKSVKKSSSKAISSGGSGDLTNGRGGGPTEIQTNDIQAGFSKNNKESVNSGASSTSLLNDTSVGGSGSFSGGHGRPGTVSEESEDEVFLYEGDDFGQLDSVFSDDDECSIFLDEDQDRYDDDDKDKDDMAEGYESDYEFIPMDDGSRWKAV